jgi:hypothetical protein
MNDQSSAPAEHAGCSIIRRWLRFPPDRSEMPVILEGEPKNAVVLDESFGGIGVMLEMEDAVNLQVGDALVVLYYDRPTPGQVQRIQRNPETKQVRVGIRWTS